MPRSVLITIGCLLFQAVFWLGYTILMLFGGAHLLHVPLLIKWLITLAALIGALVLAGAAWLVSKRDRKGWYLSVLMLSLIAVLSLTDQLGWLDLLSFAVSLLPLLLLLRDRQWYCLAR